MSYLATSRLDSKTVRLLKDVYSVDHFVVTSEIEAFLLEAHLIKRYKPFFNIKLADDKFFPYIRVAKTDPPYVQITRKKDEENASYFGPYPSVKSLKTVLRLVRRIFPFQSVKNHPRFPCLYYHLNLCPCIPAYPENLARYKNNLRKLKKFLEGNTKSVILLLERDQKNFVRQEEFEKAKVVYEKIDRIRLITSKYYDPFTFEEKPNFYYDKIAKEVTSLKNILVRYKIFVPALIRIECYDISNILGRQATGSMVVFKNGDASKSDYRKFRIKSITTPDDFAMLQEVIRRRLKHTEWEFPDLFVVDGGRGQVSAVLEELSKNKIDIPTIGLAKREEIIIIPISSAFQGSTLYQGSTLTKVRFRELKLPLSDPAVNLLRRIRDEAHRFALTYHRLLRKKALVPQS